jgi:hypothetical protein
MVTAWRPQDMKAASYARMSAVSERGGSTFWERVRQEASIR